MSYEYNQYLESHITAVRNGMSWLEFNLQGVIPTDINWSWISLEHDRSKYNQYEYNAYDAYFYGPTKSHAVVQEFNRAWLHHIHNNPHHWQHWILINDDPKEGTILIEMPYQYIIEMICDWWSFSWRSGDLTEIFKWYDEHKDHIQLNINTRKTVEMILEKMRLKLKELK